MGFLHRFCPAWVVIPRRPDPTAGDWGCGVIGMDHVHVYLIGLLIHQAQGVADKWRISGPWLAVKR
jgi:hypothetical protein